jgi:uncharacterized protein YdeI (YjbR/CyaY-like superfamily)
MTVSPADPQFFATAAEFRQWLERHAASCAELIVGFHKVGSDRPSMRWPESVDEALCFGWIDGIRRRIDEHSYQIRFTPRKAGSTWSAVNIAKYHKLHAAGRVEPAGAKAFALRIEEKSVTYSYEQQETARLSSQEEREFRKHKLAWRYFEATPASYRKTVLHWIVSAKRPQTRASRFARLLAACAGESRLR